MYLLDTNILSELVKKRPNPHVLSQLRSNLNEFVKMRCDFIRYMKAKFFKYRNRIKTSPGGLVNIDEDIKLARKQRTRRYRREKVLPPPKLFFLEGIQLISPNDKS